MWFMIFPTSAIRGMHNAGTKSQDIPALRKDKKIGWLCALPESATEIRKHEEFRSLQPIPKVGLI